MLGSISTVEERCVHQQAFGAFLWQFGGAKTIRKADVVIALFDVHYLSSLYYYFTRPARQKWIWWGIGFGSGKWANRLRIFIAKRSNGVALYMPGNIEAFARAGVPREKLFWVRNTIEVRNPSWQSDLNARKAFLFFGTLKKRKGIDILVRTFASLLPGLPPDVMLEIVGDGECRSDLVNLVESLGITDRVTFHGAIFEEKKLQPIFLRALAMVSPAQAGLSILQSFAFGVPVITLADAISGGELENLKDGENGFLCGSNHIHKTICSAMRFMVDNPDRSVQMGKNAHDYYVREMTLTHMVNSFEQAIESVMK